MTNRTRRNKLGEMLLDVDKYILTVVVVGGFFAPGKLSPILIIAGFVIAVVIVIMAVMIDSM